MTCDRLEALTGGACDRASARGPAWGSIRDERFPASDRRNEMVPPIVIGAHPKRHEQEPIELGVMFSRMTRAPMDVVGTYWFDTTAQRQASDEYGRMLRNEVMESLQRAVGDTGRVCGEVRVHVASGGAAYALHEKAVEVGAGLIIVGSTHRGAVGRIALGTTADRVLDHSPCPVAVAPRGFRDEGATPQRVGVAFVDTPGGRSALRAGAAIAEAAGASLIAYTVIEPHTNDFDRERAELAVADAIGECAGH
ncbi:MAG: hypothetical protein AVDCRST_MAG69-2574, partial [uncultured Solirubrobacteraceae bacterium]